MIDPAVLLQLIHDLQARALEAEARAQRAEAELVARSRTDNPASPAREEPEWRSP